MTIYIPYTYLIGWTEQNKWYYGSEYGNKTKTANPQNLWNTYFTSSKVVEEYRQKYGEPDVIQVRKKFETAQSAIDWEKKVLRKVKALYLKKWLNQHTGGSPKGNRSPRTEKQIEAAKKSIRITLAKRKKVPFKGQKHTQDSIQKMIKSVGKLTCPHCGLTGSTGNMRRWHMDNCRS